MGKAPEASEVVDDERDEDDSLVVEIGDDWARSEVWVLRPFSLDRMLASWVRDI
jgi:hypothetical protein